MVSSDTLRQENPVNDERDCFTVEHVSLEQTSRTTIAAMI